MSHDRACPDSLNHCLEVVRAATAEAFSGPFEIEEKLLIGQCFADRFWRPSVLGRGELVGVGEPVVV